MSTKPQTKQQVFDKVAKHLLKQNAVAADSYGNCKYLTSTGLKCAVGCLIPKSKYSETLEGTNLQGGNEVCDTLEKLGINIVGKGGLLYMLQRLQDVHDLHEPEEWPEVLKKVAKAYKLKWNIKPAKKAANA